MLFNENKQLSIQFLNYPEENEDMYDDIDL